MEKCNNSSLYITGCNRENGKRKKISINSYNPTFEFCFCEICLEKLEDHFFKKYSYKIFFSEKNRIPTSKHKKTLLEKYNVHVRKNENKCWSWKGLISPFGYGSLRFEGKQIAAHRVSWIIHYGEIPYGLYVLHKCDNPPCTNPQHLFLGTQKDNMLDKKNKGRARGRKSIRSKNESSNNSINNLDISS